MGRRDRTETCTCRHRRVVRNRSCRQKDINTNSYMLMLKGENMHAHVNTSKRPVMFGFSFLPMYVHNPLEGRLGHHPLIQTLLSLCSLTATFGSLIYFRCYVLICTLSDAIERLYRHARLLSFLFERIFVKYARCKKMQVAVITSSCRDRLKT